MQEKGSDCRAMRVSELTVKKESIIIFTCGKMDFEFPGKIIALESRM